MPDWTYRTIFKPILTRLPFEFARKQALGPLGFLSIVPGGNLIVRLFGHAEPSEAMQVEIGGVKLPSVCGLSQLLDPDGHAEHAWPLLGIGLIQTGRVTTDCPDHAPNWDRSRKSLSGVANRLPVYSRAWPPTGRLPWLREEAWSTDMGTLVTGTFGCCPVVMIAFTSSDSGVTQATAELLDAMREKANELASGEPGRLVRGAEEAFGAGSWLAKRVRKTALDYRTPAFCFGLALSPDDTRSDDRLQELMTVPWQFVFVRPDADEEGVQHISRELLIGTTKAVKRVRDVACSETRIIAHGGVEEPADALQLREAGADIVMLDSGLVESGPGLPKRISKLLSQSVPTDAKLPQLGNQSWFWTMLLGVALLIGGGIAVAVGLSRIVLPYDEEFLGMLREELCGLNPKLLDFMQHDRITLAGTMLSLGILYVVCGACGERRGRHWVRVATLISAAIGFFSFFLFLGYGYFDPFHAFITAVLFQFVLFGFRSQLLPDVDPSTDRHNSAAWQRALWGQLIFVVHGFAIVVAGCVICGYGATDVFVREDLEFMQTTREALVSANARLVPLVAHDRAAFGGMLVSTGVFVTLASLWGWRRGDRWLWWSLLISGSIAYLLTVGIHWYVGYTSLKHLLPAYGGLAAVILSSVLSRRWLCAR